MSSKKQSFDDYFCNIRSLNSLGQVLKMDVHQLELLAERPPYRTFRIPKADGSERVIEEIADLLARLCTYQTHLPMGAPTSPVLSNFACIPLDKSLAQFSEHQTGEEHTLIF